MAGQAEYEREVEQARADYQAEVAENIRVHADREAAATRKFTERVIEIEAKKGGGVMDTTAPGRADRRETRS